MNNIFKKTNPEYEINEIIKKLLSIAKQYGLEEINVPLWSKEFPLIPSLYCSNINTSAKLLRDLKDHMDIELSEGYIYFNDKCNGISEFDDCRYIKIHMLSIRNISKIKYFGIERELTYGYEVLFKNFSNRLEKSIIRNMSNEDFSINNCIVKSKNPYNEKNSYIAFLIAINRVKSYGYLIDLNVSKATHTIDNKFLLNKNRVVFLVKVCIRERLKIIK